jgi:hypothetical protein
MSLVQAIVAARSQMAALVADETAKIATNKGGEYKFKYVSLSQIIETVTPALLAHGVVLLQNVSNHMDKPNLVSVETRLMDDDAVVRSGELWLVTDGSPKDVGMKVTTARRIQLMALLGMAVSDEDDGPPRAVVAGPRPVSTPMKPVVVGSGDTNERSKAARLSRDLRNASPALTGLIARIQADDLEDADDMPITPLDGKSMSMYGYLTSLVSPSVLSFLYGRVISQQTPPTLATRWLIDEVRSGKLDDVIDEVRKHLGEPA